MQYLTKGHALFIAGLALITTGCDMAGLGQSSQGPLPSGEPSASATNSDFQIDESMDRTISSAAAPSILEFGPVSVKAAEPFNVQPSGLSAIWVRADRPLAGGSFLRLNGQDLFGTPRGDRIGVQVPPELTAIPGSLRLEIVQVIDGQEVVSAPVEFIVK